MQTGKIGFSGINSNALMQNMLVRHGGGIKTVVHAKQEMYGGRIQVLYKDMYGNTEQETHQSNTIIPMDLMGWAKDAKKIFTETFDNFRSYTASKMNLGF